MSYTKNTATSDDDFKDTTALMLSAVGFTAEYAMQWPLEDMAVALV